jgi:hypothetical protein
MNIFPRIQHAIARIRSSYRDTPINPNRDWVSLLLVLCIACLVLISVGVASFRSMRANTVPAVSRGSGVETIDRGLLKETIAAFRARAATTEKFFEAPPSFGDPSR